MDFVQQDKLDAPASRDDYGILSGNFCDIRMLRQTVSLAASAFRVVPQMLLDLIREDGWRHWIDPYTGSEVTRGPGDLRKFLEAPEPAGFGFPVDLLLRFFEAGSPERAEFLLALGEAESPADPAVP